MTELVLTRGQVVAIKRAYRSGELTQKEIAKMQVPYAGAHELHPEDEQEHHRESVRKKGWATAPGSPAAPAPGTPSARTSDHPWEIVKRDPALTKDQSAGIRRSERP